MTPRRAGRGAPLAAGALRGALLGLLVLLGCGSDASSSRQDAARKIAFVYVGSPRDGGWTYRHDEGASSVAARLGDAVAVTRLANIPEGPESVAVFERLAAEGNELIFGASYGYGEPMREVAERRPGTCFMHASGAVTSANLGTYFGAAEEGRYLTGLAAGRVSRRGVVGYVAAFPIPEVIRGINAFTLGVRAVKPGAVVKVAWTNTWFDHAKERATALTLLNEGVDVVTQHQDTSAVGEAAQVKGAKWIGYHADMSNVAPDSWVTAVVWDWGPYYIRTTQQVFSGVCPTEPYYGGMADGLVNLANFGASVDAVTRDFVEGQERAMKRGELEPFAGPILDQAGNERAPAGAALGLEQLLTMDYFVQGVDGALTT